MDYFDYNDFSDFDVEAFLEESQEREKQRLESELEEIERQLEERDQLHGEIVEELESKLDWYLERLERMYKQMRGSSGERERLKGKISSFYTRIQEEKQQHWQDKQELEHEKRQLLQSIDELEELDDLSNIFK